MGSLENLESVTIILEPEAAAIHCRNARLKHSKVLSKISFQDTYETDYCVLNEVSEGKKCYCLKYILYQTLFLLLILLVT